ncbi:MAG: sarcosine oxidase subunit gamma, partial [Paracoccaceae bacterium]|nr:sarcosine oxidase subunit gamma [Paracoccaceae bacterium]
MKPLTPLGHDEPETVIIGPVIIVETVGSALASLASRLGRHADVARAAVAGGIPLPGPGLAKNGTPFSAFWIGPDHWMIEAAFDSHEDIAAQMRPIFGDSASITEQTDAWVRFDLQSLDLPALFARLCTLDIAAMPPGAATRTAIEHLGCYLIRR